MSDIRCVLEYLTVYILHICYSYTVIYAYNCSTMSRHSLLYISYRIGSLHSYSYIYSFSTNSRNTVSGNTQLDFGMHFLLKL